jgi:hypothetical protein
LKKTKLKVTFYKLNISFPLLIFFSIGCAFSEGRIKPNYLESINTLKINKNITVTITKAVDHPDQFRNGIFRQGIRKNGYGMETANMFTDPKGPEIIRNVVTLELQNAGFIISNTNTEKNPEIEIEVINLFMEPEVGFFAGDVITVTDVNITVIIKNKSFKRRFKGIGVSTTLLWTDYFYEVSLKASLQDFSKKAIPEIINLIESETNQR